MWWKWKTKRDTGGYPQDWNRRRRKIFHRDNWTCQSCGRTGGAKGNAELHAHHKLPISQGGSHDLENLTTLCDQCHAEYHNDPRLLSNSKTSRSKTSGHLKVGLLTAWWTFGIGNLLYELVRRRRESDESQIRKNRKEGIKKLKEQESRRRRGKEGEPRPSWFKAHKGVFFSTGWWSFGLGNLVFELLREPGTPKVGDDNRPRLGKREGKKGFWQKRADNKRNEHYGGCPSCGKRSLTLSIIKLKDGTKAKAVECSACSSIFDETNDGLIEVEDATELDSAKSAVMLELFG